MNAKILRPGLILDRADVYPTFARAGDRGQWTVVLSGLELSEGDRIRVSLGGDNRYNRTDWLPLQVGEPAADDYAGIRSDGETSWRVDAAPAPGVGVVATLERGRVRAGEVVRVVIGDRHGGGQGSRAQTFSEQPKVIDVAVARQGQEWQSVENPPMLRVLGGDPHHLRLLAPSTVACVQEFSVTVRCEDEFNNLSPNLLGLVEVNCPGDALDGDRVALFAAHHQGVLHLSGLSFRREGLFRLTVAHQESGLTAVSNPIRVTEEPPALSVAWGLLHCHSSLSDGHGSPTHHYRHMRSACRLDFGAVTDHDDPSETTDDDWRQLQKAASRHHAPDRFVTLLGYEWGRAHSPGDGHRCVYYLDDFEPIHRSTEESSITTQRLSRALSPHRVLVIPHHTSLPGRHADFKHHDPEQERLIEIYSNRGSSECMGAENAFPLRPEPGAAGPWAPVEGGCVQAALARGLRYGFTAGGGDHHGHSGDHSYAGAPPFRYQCGLTGVLVRELTRRGLWEALYQRRTWATTGARMLVAFSLNGTLMGGEIFLTDQPALHERRTLRIEIVGQDDIARVTVVRNNEQVYCLEPGAREVVFDWTDTAAFDSVALLDDGDQPFIFYYVRIVQTNGETVWVSPIWVS